MLKVIVEEFDWNDVNSISKFYEVDIDGKDKSPYRARKSYGSFLHGPSDKNLSPDGRIFMFVCYGRTTPTFELHEKIHGKIDLIEVESLWEFYKLIGYDYKKKKWIK